MPDLAQALASPTNVEAKRKAERPAKRGEQRPIEVDQP
jgi:hypothetical protein